MGLKLIPNFERLIDKYAISFHIDFKEEIMMK
jgi:hypothetical protein